MRVHGLWLTVASVLILGGCVPPEGQTGPKTGPGQEQKTLADLFKPSASKSTASSAPSEVMKVVCFYRPNPFLSFDREGDPDPEGFTFTLFLISRSTSKGVLEDGLLNVKMYRAGRGTTDGARRALIREWTAETDKLVQSSKPHPLFGMGYQPQFAWEKTDDVLGHDVEVVAAFGTRDGRTIQSQTKSLRVPAHRD